MAATSDPADAVALDETLRGWGKGCKAERLREGATSGYSRARSYVFRAWGIEGCTK